MTAIHLKVAPHNVEAEQAVLAGVLINNEALNQIMDVLRPDDFYKEGHSVIFQGMVDLYSRSEPIDLITLSEHLRTKKDSARGTEAGNLLDKAGGVEYLASLVDAVSTSAGIRYHAEILREHSLRRNIIAQCSRACEACFEQWRSAEEILEQTEQALFDLRDRKPRDAFSTMLKVIRESVSGIEERSKQQGALSGLSSGFVDLDRMTAGLQPSELVIVAGRPSMGKTALALCIGYHVAKEKGKSVAVFSLEMSEKQLGVRLLSLDAQIDASRLRTGFLREDEWARLISSADRLSELPIFVDDSSGLTVLEIKSKCRRLMKQQPIALVIVDYLQLLEGRGQGRAAPESRQLEISEVTRSLKGLAKDLDIPVLALSQLNRKVEDRPNRRPQLSDLRESGSIEQDADTILFICRDEQYAPTSEENRNIAEIILAKQRNGPTGQFRLTFLKEFTRFENYVHDRVSP